MEETEMTVGLPAQLHLRGEASDIHKLLWPRFVGLRKEHLWRIDLDSRGRVLGAELVSIGSINMTAAHPREIFGPALQNGACKIALVHNHVSGDVRPSSQDLRFFDRLTTCGMLLGVEVEDQLIIHEEKIFSLKADGRTARGSPWKRRRQ